MQNGKEDAAGNGKRDFRPTNLFVHTDVFPDPAATSEHDLRAGLETTSLTFEDEILRDGTAEDKSEDGDEVSEGDEEGYCWRNFWCFCCNRARRRRRRRKRRGEGRKRESDYGVLIIVVGLVVFSVFYFFSRTSVYKIIPLQ